MKVAFYTFGCRLNQAETATLERAFLQHNFQIVKFNDPYDIVVVNTCTVTKHGDDGTRKLVNRIRKNNSSAKIALVGCQAQTQGEKLAEILGVQWVVGNELKLDLPSIITESLNKPVLLNPDISKDSFTIPVAGIDRRHARANIKIQDGCNFFCTFCEIPYARGRARSREFDDILKEANILVNAGHHELVLTGINIGTYQNSDKGLLDIIKAFEKIPDLWRIRITSVEARTVDNDLIDYMAADNKLCRFLHISLQSGSDTILKSMRRRYTTEQFSDYVNLAHEKIQNVCIGTDVIVGFPGETDALFDETVDFMESQPFSYFHVFSYSDRLNNKSRTFPDKVQPEKIVHRSEILRKLSAEKRRTYMEKQLDKTELVLIEQKRKGLWSGVTDTFIRVNIESDLDLKNQLVPIKLEHINEQKIIGTLA